MNSDTCDEGIDQKAMVEKTTQMVLAEASEGREYFTQCKVGSCKLKEVVRGSQSKRLSTQSGLRQEALGELISKIDLLSVRGGFVEGSGREEEVCRSIRLGKCS